MSSLDELVAELTTTGYDALDAEKLKQLKQECKTDTSGQTIVEVFTLLLKALKKTHAQVRISALQVINELFSRSHQFRLLLIRKLPQFIALVLGSYQKKLPPPKRYAEKLKLLAAEHLYTWVEKFGFAYQRLVYAYRYLRYVEKVDFRSAARAYKRTDPERAKRRHEFFVRNRREYMWRTLVAVRADIMTKKLEIERAVAYLNNCFEVLIPDIADMFGVKESFVSRKDKLAALKAENAVGTENSVAKFKAENRNADDEDDLDEILAVMATNRHAIQIEFNPEKALDVEENEDNAAIYDTLRDYLQICVQVYTPLVDKWIERLDQVNDELEVDVAELKSTVRQIKGRLYRTVAKCRDLGIDFAYMDSKKYEDSGDDEFEDVPFIASALEDGKGSQSKKESQTDDRYRKRNQIFALLGETGLESDPTVVDPRKLRYRSENSLLKKRTRDMDSDEQQAQSSNPIEDKLREIAPVVSYDTDLMYWNSDDINANTSGLEIRHRFLGSARDEPKIPSEAARRMRMRAVYLKDLHSHSHPSDAAATDASGEGDSQRREIKACRAPLKSGKLCPRRDLVKCPFHGVIIPRDEFGRPQGQTAETQQLEQDQPQPLETAGADSRQSNEPSSVATAETMDDLRAEDIELLIANKHQLPAATRGRTRRKKGDDSNSSSALINIRKKKPSGISHLRKAVRKYM
ncbi:hypothetical protein BX070DRAFT_229623 [Coemansia spiralis]|nr:hypothetical protein BX070DRAFT_229623 [Coemansia spiralis]